MRAMPHAIERSLATPITRPRFPAISGPGFAKSISVMTFTVTFTVVASGRPFAFKTAFRRSFSCSRARRSSSGNSLQGRHAGLLRRHAAKHEGGIRSAEPEAVRHDTVKINAVETLTDDRHTL